MQKSDWKDPKVSKISSVIYMDLISDMISRVVFAAKGMHGVNRDKVSAIGLGVSAIFLARTMLSKRSFSSNKDDKVALLHYSHISIETAYYISKSFL